MLKRISVLVGMGLLALGCGRSIQGTYNGMQTVSFNNGYGYTGYGTNTNGQQTQTQDYTQTLSLNLNDNGSSVTGTLSNSYENGTITYATSDGSTLSNVQLTMNFTNLQGLMNPSMSNYGSGQSCQEIFTGNLTINGNNLNGTLNAQSAICGITKININVNN